MTPTEITKELAQLAERKQFLELLAASMGASVNHDHAESCVHADMRTSFSGGYYENE